MKICAMCSEPISGSKKQKYCSDDCRDMARKLYDRDYYSRKLSKTAKSAAEEIKRLEMRAKLIDAACENCRTYRQKVEELCLF